MTRKGQLLIYCLLLCSINSYAQPDTNVLFGSRDTVFVYDTIFVVDTIQILRTSKELEDLEKLTPLEISYLHDSSSNKKTLDFSNQQTATLFNLRINSLNNFKNKEMKKLGILGLMFFAFQNMTSAQNNFGIYAGSGVHNLTEVYGLRWGDPSDNTLFRPAIQLGVSYRKLIAKEKLFLDVGLAFNKLRPSRTLMEQKQVENGRISEKGLFTIKETEFISPDESITRKRNYNVTSIPVSLSLNSKFFQPTIGTEIYLRDISSSAISSSMGNQQELLFHGFPPFRSIGWATLLGFRLPITQRFDINIIYVRQLYLNASFRDLIAASSLNGKMQRLDFSIRYRFMKKKKV